MNLFDIFRGGSANTTPLGGLMADKPGSDLVMPAKPTLDRREKFALIAAAISDAAGTLNGKGGTALASTQKLLQSRAQRDQQARLLGSLFPSGTPGTPPITPGQAPAAGETATPAAAPAGPARIALNLRDPATQRALIALKGTGYDTDTLVEIAKANQPSVKVGPDGTTYDENDPAALGRRFGNPTNINGWVTDVNKPENQGRYFGEAPVKGAEPLLDQRGQHVGWKLMDGTVQAIGAATRAETTGRTAGTMFNINNDDGTTTQMLGGDYLSGRGGAGAGRSQSPADKEYEGVKAKDEAAKFQAFVKEGQNAPGNIARYQRMGQLLDGVNGNALSPVGNEIARFATTAGLKIDPKLGNKEAADALANQLVLDLTGGSLGVAISNADRSFLKDTVPRQTQTAEGRRNMVAWAIKGEERKAEVARMARAWEQKAGRLDKPDRSGKTFYDYLDAWSAKRPLFSVKN